MERKSKAVEPKPTGSPHKSQVPVKSCKKDPLDKTESWSMTRLSPRTPRRRRDCCVREKKRAQEARPQGKRV